MNKINRQKFIPLLAFIGLFAGGLSIAGGEPGTRINPIIDSAMDPGTAFKSLSPDCPDEIKINQSVLSVKYYSFDGKIHQGQIIVDKRLAADIREVFAVALEHRFPFGSVIPLSDSRFLDEGTWSDRLSMKANNTSAFNYRAVTGGGALSKHALGTAIDINPKLNPYIKGKTVLPPGAAYNINAEGTLSKNHPIVRTFLRLGWTWGGTWRTLKDYQHFEKEINHSSAR